MTKPKQKPKEYKCDLCDKILKAPTALGMHKRLVHGIAGTSPASKKYHEAKALIMNSKSVEELQPETAVHPNDINTSESVEIVKTEKRKYTPRRSNLDQARKNAIDFSNEEALALFTCGKFTAYAEAISEEYGLSKKPFTRRCAELFFASQVRE